MKFPYLKTNWSIYLNSLLQLLLLIIIYSQMQMSPAFEGTIKALWQFMPLEILHKEGFISLYYIHQQPPLLTLILILGLKIVGIEGINDLIKYLMIIILFGNLITINLIIIKTNLNRIFSWIYILFPSFALYHTWYYEPVFTLFFTNLIILGLVNKDTKNNYLYNVIGFVGLSLTHSTFHPIIIIGLLTLTWMIIFKEKNSIGKKSVLIIIILILIPIIFLIKNIILVGSPAMSSWSGCNLHQKFDQIGTGFDYKPEEISNAPELLGAASFYNGSKINTNNLNFAKHCNENLRLIIEKLDNKEVVLNYINSVVETIKNNESVLSIEYRGAGFSPHHWGKLNVLIDWIISKKHMYSSILLIVAIIGPLLALVSTINTTMFNPLLILNILYYYAFLMGHLANGWEQMRMAYRSSFFIYLCILIIFQRNYMMIKEHILKIIK